MTTVDASFVLAESAKVLMQQLIEDEFRRTGQRPTEAEIMNVALEALRISRLGDSRRTAVVAALLAFGNELAPGETLSDDPAANQLVMDDGFAFLVGVIFDQGISFRRAWAAPFELKKRLGHLDPARIAGEPELVAAAISHPPSLHRFVNNVSRWVVSASRRVVEQYAGRADAIWDGSPTATEVQRRLDEFDGIAQKKAAMAVELLERVKKVPISDMQGSDVAYDRHVRRVFLRTGLALYDDPDHIVAMARQLNVDRPGAIDFPTWRVGVDWCHPGVPDCTNCRLRDPCPKLVDRAASVKGG
jgi:uncharacterized HhH-GPD family protein